MFIEPSNTAGEIRNAFDIITVMCVVLLVMVTVTMLVFLFKYNSKKKRRASEVKDSIPLEITWTIVPTVLVLIMFYFGWVNFGHMRDAPRDAMPVHVIGRQWQWSFKYQNGKDSNFEKWYETKARIALTPAAKGKALLQSKGCLGCHTTDGTRKVGPTYKGLFGSKVTVMTDGKERTVAADEEYIERSIKDPGADIVKGYPPVMPKLPVTDEDIQNIIAYMKTLK